MYECMYVCSDILVSLQGYESIFFTCMYVCMYYVYMSLEQIEMYVV